MWRCSTFRAPLLRLDIFRHRRFTIATVNQLGSQFAIFAFFFWMPLFLINVWGWSAAGVGWAVAIPLVMSMNSVPIGRFADRHGYRGVLAVGGLFGAGGLAWCYLVVGDGPAFWSQLFPGLLLFGWGIGMVGITSASAALAGLEAEELAMANSMFQTTRRLVQTLGIASVVAILGDRSADSLELFQRVWLVTGVGFLISSSWPCGTRRPGCGAPSPAAVRRRGRPRRCLGT